MTMTTAPAYKSRQARELDVVMTGLAAAAGPAQRDTASALLVGGTWHPGRWYYLVEGGRSAWASEEGQAIDPDHVQGVDYGTARMAGFRAALAELHGAERCPGSAVPARVDIPGETDDEGLTASRRAEPGEQVWCVECEYMVDARVEAGVDVDKTPVTVEHDRLGRQIRDGVLW